MTDRDIEEKLRAWFNKTGFPLEIETARSFFSQKFGVEHSAVYEDPETQKSREIDVLAYRRDATGVFSTLFPIECKSTDKPWVVLTNRSQYSRYGGLWIAAMSAKAREFMGSEVEEYISIYTDTFGPFAGGFSLKQAFSGETDQAYMACISALKAAKSLAAEDSNGITFAFPTLVVNAPIFEYHEQDGEQIFSEVSESSLYFSAHIKEYSRAIIRIVSKGALGDYSQRCRTLSDRYEKFFVRPTKSLFLGGT